MEREILLDNNSTSVDNASTEADTHTYVNIERYTVVTNCVLFAVITLPGLLANLCILLSTSCKKSVRGLQYGLHYTLFCINLLMCLVWLPLHFIQLMLLFSGQHPHAAICYISSALFHFCLASMLCLSISLGVLHLNHLSTSPMAAIRALVVYSIPASLLTAVVLTGLVVWEQPYNFEHAMCVSGATTPIHEYAFWYSLLNLLLSIAYVTILLIIVILLYLAIHAIRQRIGEMVEQAPDGNQATDSIEDYPEDTYENSREEPSKHSSVTFKEPEVTDTTPNRNGIARTNSPSPKALKFKCAKDKGTDDDDDDMFEKKMRMRMQKSGSNRRHTVANIGLGDSRLGSKRRSSLEVPQHPYSYMKEYDVDVIALQNQLEHPRHAGSFPFNDLGILPEKVHRDTSRHSELHSHEEEEEESDSNAENATDTLIDKSPVRNNNTGSGKNINEVSSTNDVTTMSDQKTNKHDAIASNDTNNVSDARSDKPLLTHVPSIIIDQNSQNCVISKEHDITMTEHEDEIQYVKDEVLCKFHKQLKKTKRYVMFYLFTLMFISPFCIVQMFQNILGAHLSVNLTYITAPLCVVNTLIQPLWLAWIDTRLRCAMRRLWNNLTPWKCVCYCNIGKGKNFFGKPVELEEKIQTELGSTVC